MTADCNKSNQNMNMKCGRLLIRLRPALYTFIAIIFGEVVDALDLLQSESMGSVNSTGK